MLDGSFGTESFQVGANANETIDISIPNADAATLGVATIDISTQAGAQAAIAAIDGALQTVDAARGELGAVQNRLLSTISNLSNVAENVTAARSRIMDADFAAETANLTRASILQQAGISVLAQANALPQQALALLQ
jgi:flagellin